MTREERPSAKPLLPFDKGEVARSAGGVPAGGAREVRKIGVVLLGAILNLTTPIFIVRAPSATASTLPLEQGRRSYVIHCSNCHGVEGDGKGPSAPGLRPPPRNFRQGTFKWGSVPSGELPTDEDLLRIIRSGLSGTAMLSWKDIPDGELVAIVSYLKTFSPRWKSGKPGTPITVSPDPWEDARHTDAVAKGRILYHGLAQCQSCHPAYEKPEALQAEILAATGRPWMPRADAGFGVLKESDFGTKLMPPDFRADPVRSVRKGQERSDLFRVIAAGVGGTAMPTWKGILKDADIWALAHYVDSLRRHGETGRANAD